MNFKKPKTEDLTSTALTIGSGIAGAMASNVAVAQIIGDKQDEDAKKAENKRRLVKGITAVISLGAMACVDGKETSAQVVKGALLGAAVQQGVSLIKEFIDEKADASKMLKQAVGLGCPCNQQPLANPVWITPISSYEDSSYEIEKPVNPLVDFSKSALNGYAKSF